MEKTYQILLTLNVPDSDDKTTIKEAIYSYLEELIEDDTLTLRRWKMINEIFKLIIGITVIAMMCLVFLYYGGYYG